MEVEQPVQYRRLNDVAPTSLGVIVVGSAGDVSRTDPALFVFDNNGDPEQQVTPTQEGFNGVTDSSQGIFVVGNNATVLRWLP